MAKIRSKVSLVTDINEAMQEFATPQPMWMAHPRLARKHPNQRMLMTAEVVDLSTVNLAKMPTVEIL